MRGGPTAGQLESPLLGSTFGISSTQRPPQAQSRPFKSQNPTGKRESRTSSSQYGDSRLAKPAEVENEANPSSSRHYENFGIRACPFEKRAFKGRFEGNGAPAGGLDPDVRRGGWPRSRPRPTWNPHTGLDVRGARRLELRDDADTVPV